MNKYGQSFEKDLAIKKQQLGKDYVETWDERVARQTAEENERLRLKKEQQDLKGAFVGEVNKGQRIDGLRGLGGGMH